MVLFGGAAGSFQYLSDTWVWNGTNWTQRFSATSPSPRMTTMAYDKAQNEVVLFSGDGQADTWTWNGASWTLRSPSNSPPALSGHLMVYDETRAGVILHGGQYVGFPLISSETWVWNGSTWIFMASGPSGIYFAMADDTARSQGLFFGGGQFTGITFVPRSDTVAWDGTGWTLLAPHTNPPGSFAQSMVTTKRGARSSCFSSTSTLAPGLAVLRKSGYGASDLHQLEPCDCTEPSWANHPAVSPEHRRVPAGGINLFDARVGPKRLRFGC